MFSRYLEIPLIYPYARTYKDFTENVGKLRYSDISPYDKNAVFAFGEYTTSSHMKINGYDYIAAQAPTLKTIPSFWGTILEHNISIVAMLCNEHDIRFGKCVCYWPQPGNSYDTLCGSVPITVVGVAEYQNGNCILRSFLVNNTPVKHIQMLDWKDHAPPSELSFLKLLDELDKTGTNLVHCSAGVGRTGTTILVDSILRSDKRDTDFIFATMESMRHQRPFMMPNYSQFEFAVRYVESVSNMTQISRV